MTDKDSNIKARISVITPEQKFSSENSASSGGWHPADIKAALEKRGLTLAELSRSAGYSPTAAGRALRTAWPAVEQVIAEALDVTPQDLWPDRYDTDGVPLAYKPRTRRRGGGR